MTRRDLDKKRANARRWYERNREKKKAYSKLLRDAKRAHPIPQKCSAAGCEAMGERHHPDYSKPTEVVWLCKAHHEAEHHKSSCSVCGKKEIGGNGMCRTHYKSWAMDNVPGFGDTVRAWDAKRRLLKRVRRSESDGSLTALVARCPECNEELSVIPRRPLSKSKDEIVCLRCVKVIG